jgi:hypothetical protein
VLGDKYTHYDLHRENACVYKPYTGKNYILMRFHSNGKVYEFPSEYIVKVIDYGRNYINNGPMTTEDVIDIICNEPTCKPRCGENYGYSVIQGDTSFYNIVPTKPNASHDLRVFSEINSRRMPDLWKGRIYKDDFYYKELYGTPENLTGDYAHVRSIHDLRAAIEQVAYPMYKSEIYKKYDASWTKVAEMDIYDDGRDYEFKVV